MVSVRTLAKVIEQLLSKESPASGSLWECFRSPLEAFVRLREIQDENGEGGIDEASDREEGETNNDDEFCIVELFLFYCIIDHETMIVKDWKGRRDCSKD